MEHTEYLAFQKKGPLFCHDRVTMDCNHFPGTHSDPRNEKKAKERWKFNLISPLSVQAREDIFFQHSYVVYEKEQEPFGFDQPDSDSDDENEQESSGFGEPAPGCQIS